MKNYNKRFPTIVSLISSICTCFENMMFNGDCSDACQFLTDLSACVNYHNSRYKKKLEEESERICRKMEHDSDLPF